MLSLIQSFSCIRVGLKDWHTDEFKSLTIWVKDELSTDLSGSKLNYRKKTSFSKFILSGDPTNIPWTSIIRSWRNINNLVALLALLAVFLSLPCAVHGAAQKSPQKVDLSATASLGFESLVL